MNVVDRLTSLIMNLNQDAERDALGKSEKELLASACPEELAVAQQKLLAAGMNAKQLWQVWTKNNKLLPDQVSKLKSELASNHVLRWVFAEHDITICFIADLEEVNEKIKEMNDASSTTAEIRQLAHIVTHLLACEEHNEREDEIIFPELKKRGYYGLLNILTEQHIEMTRITYELNALIWQIDEVDFKLFKSRLNDLVNYIVTSCRMHIFIEGNIIFPIAVGIINDGSIWKKMKRVCDDIGYCGCHIGTIK